MLVTSITTVQTELMNDKKKSVLEHLHKEKAKMQNVVLFFISFLFSCELYWR